MVTWNILGVFICVFMIHPAPTNGLEPVFNVIHHNVTVQPGETAVLPCNVSFKGKPVVWTDQWSTLLTFDDRRIIDDVRISILRPHTNAWNLEIRSVETQDEGEYECIINTNPVRTKRVKLLVIEPYDGVSDGYTTSTSTVLPNKNKQVNITANSHDELPSFEPGHAEVKVQTGKLAVLPCYIDNLNDRYKVVWRKDPQSNPQGIGGKKFNADRRFLVARTSRKDWSIHILDVKKEDEGLYICSVVGPTHTVVEKQVKLVVKDFEDPIINFTRSSKEPSNTTIESQLSFDTTAMNVTVQSNGTAVLPCHVDNLGSHVVGWMSPKRTPLTLGNLDYTLSYTADQRVALTNSNATDWTLVINSVQKSDEGIYTCEVNTKPVQIKHVGLIVSEPQPQVSFDTKDEVVTVMTGDTAVLPCHGENLGYLVTVFWRRKSIDDVPLTSGTLVYTIDDRVSLDQPNTGDWNLRIRSVTKRDEGEYICSANTSPWVEKVVRLNVKEPIMSFDTKDEVVTVMAGDTVVLPCHGENLGYNVTVIWRKRSDAVPLTLGTSVLAMKERVSLDQANPGDWNLRILSVTKSDEGEYICSTTVSPRLEKVVRLNVTGVVFSGVEVSGTEFVTENDDILLKCTANLLYGRFSTINWFSDGNKIKASKRITISYSKQEELFVSELRMKSANLGDSGTYVCVTSDLQVGKIDVHVLNDASSNKRNTPVEQATTTAQTIFNTTFEHQTVTPTTQTILNTTFEHQAATNNTREIPVRMVDYSDDVIAVEGTDVILWCRAEGYPKPYITWYQIPTDRNQTKNELQTGNYVLEIRKVKRSHSGEYECIASCGNNSAVTRYIRLTVEFPPEITILHNNSVENGNTTRTLICQIIGNPLSYYGWTLNKNMMIQSSDRYKITECKTGEVELRYSLTIYHPDYQIGNFSCEAINQHGVSSATVSLRGQHRFTGVNGSTTIWQMGNEALNASVTVSGKNSSTQQQPTTSQPLGTSVPANIDLYPSNTVVVENSPFSLFCELQDRPKAIFSWKRNGRKFLGRAKRYDVINTPNGSILRIHDVRSKKDNADFTCVATDEYEMQQVTAKVTVYTDHNAAKQAGVPMIITSPSLRVAEEGVTVTLSCEATASRSQDTLRLYWLKDNIPVKVDGDRISYYKQGNLRINRANKDDQGAYECVAENAVGTMYSYKANLYVRVRRIPPHFIKPVPPEIRTKPGRNVTLECTAVGAPMPMVKWYREGEVRNFSRPIPDDRPISQDTLLLTNVQTSAVYTCIANNRLGQVESITKITVI